MSAQDKADSSRYWKMTAYKDAGALLEQIGALDIMDKKIAQVDLLGFSCNLFVENSRQNSDGAEFPKNLCFPRETWTNGVVRILFEDKSTFEIRPLNGISGKNVEIGGDQFTDARLQGIDKDLGRAEVFDQPGFWLHNFIIGDVSASYERIRKAPLSFYDYEGRKIILQFKNVAGVIYNLDIDFYFRCGLFYRVLLSYASSATIPIFADHKKSRTMFEYEYPIPILRGVGTFGYFTFFDKKFEYNDEMALFDNDAISIFNRDYNLLLEPFFKDVPKDEYTDFGLDHAPGREVGLYNLVEKSLGLVPNTIPANIIMDYDLQAPDISVVAFVYSYENMRKILARIKKEWGVLAEDPESTDIFTNLYKYITHKKGLPHTHEVARGKFLSENMDEIERIISFYKRAHAKLEKLMAGENGNQSVTLIGRMADGAKDTLA